MRSCGVFASPSICGKIEMVDMFTMSDQEAKTSSARDILNNHLPIVLDLVKTASLVVIAASSVHLGHHVHEMTHEGVIWRDPPGESDHSGHKH